MIRQGTATGHIDLLSKLVEFVTGRGVLSGAINAGGTGYVVGDILTVAGGTSTVAAQFEVLTEAAGVITAILPIQSGIYTVDPSTTANAVTGGSGAGATLDLVMANVGWTKRRESIYAVSAVVAAGGTGYAVGNILTLVGGTNIFPAKFAVTAVSGSIVTAVATLNDQGEYTVVPGNPVAVTGGAGSGCTLTVTWDANRNVILDGVGSGADQVFVGIRTYTVSTANNWELAGFTGYNAASRYTEQPGISPGRYSVGTPEAGCYVPLNNASITFWLFANGRRIIGVFKMGVTYTNMYLGLLNPYSTESEYPYPLAVFGCCSKYDQLFSGSDIWISGLTDPIGHTGAQTTGPCAIRDPGGTWKSVQNSGGTTGSRSPRYAVTVFPCGDPGQINLIPAPSVADYETFAGNMTFRWFIPTSGTPGTPTRIFTQTPDTPSYSTPLIPPIIFESTPVRQFIGELDCVFWCSAVGEVTNLLAEDIIMVGLTRYKVFHNGNRTDTWAFFAIRYE